MDPDKLKALADAEFNRAVHRKNLKETAQALLTVPFAGGLFVASPTLIAFLSSWDELELYVEDTYSNPVLVNRAQLLDALKTAYQTAMQTWHTEFQKSNSIRRAANV